MLYTTVTTLCSLTRDQPTPSLTIIFNLPSFTVPKKSSIQVRLHKIQTLISTFVPSTQTEICSIQSCNHRTVAPTLVVARAMGRRGGWGEGRGGGGCAQTIHCQLIKRDPQNFPNFKKILKYSILRKV